jgi:hypothetical protein
MPWWSQITPVLAALSPITGLFGVWLGQWISRRNTETQWLKDQKVKVYGDVLRAMNEYSLWLLDASEEIKFGGQARGEIQNTLNKQSQQIAAEFHSAYAVAPLFVSKPSMELIERARPIFYSHSGPFAGYEQDPDKLDAKYEKLLAIRKELVADARSGLGPK